MGNTDEKDKDGLASAGNGKESASDNGPHLVKRHLADEETTPVVQTIGHPKNRPLLSFLGDYVFEMKEHSRRVESLYQEVRLLHFPAPQPFAMKTLDEFERHHKADEGNLEHLREYIRLGG